MQTEARRGIREGYQARTKRYWFTPGQFIVQTTPQKDLAFLETAQILLKDEGQTIVNGALVASGETDAAARAFTCAWSNRMEDVLNSEVIWREMRNIYCIFALSRALVELNAFERASFDGSVFLRAHELAFTKVPDTLPGTGRIVSSDSLNISFGICGGVSLGLRDALQISNRLQRDVSDLVYVLATAGRTQDAVAWRL